MKRITKPGISSDVLGQTQSLITFAKEEGVKKLLAGGVILNHNNRILLVKRSATEDFLPGIIELPSGHVDQGETLLEALAREIKEETNLDTTTVLSIIDHFDYYSRTGKLSRQINFLISVDDLSKLKLNPAEHQESRWCNKQEAIEWCKANTVECFEGYKILYSTIDSTYKAISIKRSKYIQTFLLKFNIACKLADMITDGYLLYQIPTVANAKETALSALHLYSIHAGATQFAVAVSVLSVAHTWYKNGAYTAMQEAVVTAAYIALPAVLAAASPYAAVAYSAALGIYTGYNVVTAAYALYQAHDDAAHKLESLTAYRDSAHWWYNATGVKFFETKATEYEVALNITQCGSENLGSASSGSADGIACHDCAVAAQSTHHVTVSGDMLEVPEEL